MKAALDIVCPNEKFKPLSIDMENVDTKTKETLDLDSELFNQKSQGMSDADKIHSTILIKDKYGISNEAYHEFSMMSDLPKSSRVKKTIRNMNSEVTITSVPNGVIGVQLSLVTCLKACLKNLVSSTKATSI